MRSAPDLDRTFHALADGTRRAMIEALGGGRAQTAGELGRRFSSAQPTISKHLKVLERAGLIERAVEGRVHRFRQIQKPLDHAIRWIDRHRAFWNGAVDQMDEMLSQESLDDVPR